MALATQTGLSELPAAPKLNTVIADMCAGADTFDDLDIVRSGGMKTLFEGV